jgi:hypothetical protein
MRWVIGHWFELTTTTLLTVIAINTLDGKWNNSTIVEQLNELMRSLSPRARREAALSRSSLGGALNSVKKRDELRDHGPAGG